MEDKRLFKTLVFKGSLIIFSAHMISFILGYVRDALIMKNFGASNLADAWYIAYNIPELLFKFLLFGALGVTFVPVFIDYLAKKNEEMAWDIASSVINFATILLVVVVVLGTIFSSYLVRIFAPGFDIQTHALAAKLTVCVLPVLVFIGISGLLSSIYMAYFRYLIPSLVSVISVAFLIFFIIVFSRTLGIFSVAWGTVFGHAISLFILVLFLLIYKHLYKLRINLKHPAIKEILILMIPLIGAEVIGKGISVVSRMFASFLEPGSITAFNLASRIMDAPIIFFSTTVAVAIFPALSKYSAENDMQGFSEMVTYSIKMCLLVIFPCIVEIIVLGKPLIKILFERGKFGAHSTELTWQALLFLSFGLVFFSIRPVLARTCYALKKNWLIFKNELLGFILNFLLLTVLTEYLGIRGIALAMTIVVAVITIYLLWMLNKETGKIKISGMGLFFLKTISAAVIMWLYSYFVFYVLGTNLIFVIISSGLVYFIVLKTFKTKELDSLWKTLKELILKE